ncbi:chemotaxis protein CheD [Aquabacter sp. CN5-332]|uniref:chemotaxis protein CheD n=1 Tax=Aquabacter sp. CN5-332 TaxID=3156608 RepID=UPI0032B4EF57
MSPPDTGMDDDAGPALQVYLLPGLMHCAITPSIVTTVLGSCVSVCLTDRVRSVSGINHFILPCSEGEEASLRYGNIAIDHLTAAMRRICGPRAPLEAKVFGGAEVLPISTQGMSVGARNVAAAMARLAHLGIPVVARRTGDKGGMLIKLVSTTGEVLVRPIAPCNPAHQRAGR